jgi:hypothetical protein
MFRWHIRPTKKRNDGRFVFALGARIGYWPCVEAPFVEIALGRCMFALWHGLASLEQVEAGDR